MVEKKPYEPDTEHLSEGWWAAVMEDEEFITQASETKKTNKPGTEVESANVENDWEYVEKLLLDETVITCSVFAYNRGGILVCYEKFQGFVPVSHLDGMPSLEDGEEREERLMKYVGCRLELKVIESDPKRGRIVLSERAALIEPGQRQRLLGSIENGNILNGRVTNITNFGVFVDLGGVEGLVHISELSWGRVLHPRDIVKLNDDLDVLVLQVNRNKCRVSLSVKQLSPNPWGEVDQLYPCGAVKKGTVTQIVKFGAFTRLDDGLEGLIHISEMGLDGDSSPWEVLNEGQVVDVEIVLVDSERHRMSLRLIL